MAWDTLKKVLMNAEDQTAEDRQVKGNKYLLSDKVAEDDRIEPSMDFMDVLPFDQAAAVAGKAAMAGKAALAGAGKGAAFFPAVMGALKRTGAEAVGEGVGKVAAEDVAKVLPMDEASRMARAKEMGFDTGKTWYHGTKADIDAFDPSALGASTGAGSARQGYFFAQDPSTAADYASLSSSRDFLGNVREYPRLVDDLVSANDLVEAKYGKDWEKKVQQYWNWEGKEGPEFAAKASGIDGRDPLIERLNLAREKASRATLSDPQLKYEKILDRLNNDPELKSIDEQVAKMKAIMEKEEQPGKSYVDQSWSYQNAAARTNELKQLRRERERKIGEELNTAGSNVLPVHVKSQNPYVHDYKGEPYREMSYADIMRKAKELGHDSVLFKNTYDPANPDNRVLQDIMAVFDPSQIRSKFAKFDPSKAGSGNLSAGLAGAGLSYPLLKAILEEEEAKKKGRK